MQNLIATKMDKQQILQKAAEVLCRGGVILYPTDTIWGIGCDATNPQAIEKVYGIKHRDHGKSMLILCKDFHQVRQYVGYIDPKLEKYVSSHKSPTTVIYPQARNLPSNLVASDGSIGIRVPNSDFCRQLVGVFGKPIVSTSANFSGEPAPADFYHLDARLVEIVDFLVPVECSESHHRKSSRIIKLGADGKICVLR